MQWDKEVRWDTVVGASSLRNENTFQPTTHPGSSTSIGSLASTWAWGQCCLSAARLEHDFPTPSKHHLYYVHFYPADICSNDRLNSYITLVYKTFEQKSFHCRYHGLRSLIRVSVDSCTPCWALGASRYLCCGGRWKSLISGSLWVLGVYWIRRAQSHERERIKKIKIWQLPGIKTWNATKDALLSVHFCPATSTNQPTKLIHSSSA